MITTNNYDPAQICEKGHLINGFSVREPQHNKKFCDKCGAKVIAACNDCGAIIKGGYWTSKMPPILHNYKVPKFCDNCGKPYPWIDASVAGVKDLLNTINGISDKEKGEFIEDLNNIIRENPNTENSSNKVKKFLSNAGKEIADGVKSLIVEIVAETAKRTIWKD